MLSHSADAFRLLPWPERRLTILGWNGVQLFFVVSCLTLTMSWLSRAGRETWPVSRFLLRRVFRIAPMYWCGLLLYLALDPPGDAFNWPQLLATLTFLHGWSPGLLPTTPHGWSPVPGSWSVAAEFGFYLLFPLLVGLAGGLVRAVLGFIAALLAALLLNAAAFAYFGPAYGPTATDQFVFYWLPNQMPVFMCGFACHVLLRRLRPGGAWADAGAWIGTRATAITVLAVLGFFGLGYLTLPRMPTLTLPFLPIHVLAAQWFSVAVVALGLARQSIWINRPVILLGQASFSAYILHFAVLEALPSWFPTLFDLDAPGLSAMARSMVLFAAVTAVTMAISLLTFRLIEQPLIRLGGRFALRIAPNG